MKLAKTTIEKHQRLKRENQSFYTCDCGQTVSEPSGKHCHPVAIRWEELDCDQTYAPYRNNGYIECALCRCKISFHTIKQQYQEGGQFYQLYGYRPFCSHCSHLLDFDIEIRYFAEHEK